MTRLHNFSAGPGVLPLSVITEAKEALLEFGKSGIGIMEMSHRSAEFEEVLNSAVTRLKGLLSISKSYRVLFCTGGATQQFSAVPMNILRSGECSGYLLSGSWSEKAEEEARKFGPTAVLASSKADKYRAIPSFDPACLTTQSLPLSYLHITSNNTIFGTQYRNEPETGSIALVADCSSDLLHRPLDVSKYGLIYASAQKNLGPAGVTVVIIREDLLERSAPGVPIMTSYRTYSESNSLYNTPPTFPIYVLERVLHWIETLGGLSGIYEQNKRKAQLVYDEIDRTDFYCGHAHNEHRSLMNITFTLKDSSLEQKFLENAEDAGLSGLKGHRSVGGCRASMYNALPEESAKALVDFMREFERTNG
jgi:phosphoserine aminotransferase